jgi:hypothetical protein
MLKRDDDIGDLAQKRNHCRSPTMNNDDDTTRGTDVESLEGHAHRGQDDKQPVLSIFQNGEAVAAIPGFMMAAIVIAGIVLYSRL